MHMGHSHSHGHHSHSHAPVAPRRPVPKGWRGKLLLFSSRRAVRVLFAFLITLLPPILKPRSLVGALTKTDVGAFVLTAGLLAVADSVRDEVQALLTKGDGWRSSMLKHSTPLSTDYLFRNDNAADRVTFLGVVVNLLLSAGKFAVGTACHSSALIADAGQFIHFMIALSPPYLASTPI